MEFAAGEKAASGEFTIGESKRQGKERRSRIAASLTCEKHTEAGRQGGGLPVRDAQGKNAAVKAARRGTLCHKAKSGENGGVFFAEMEQDDAIGLALREITHEDYTPEQSVALRAGDSGSVRERASAGFSAAEWRGMERRTAGVAWKAGDAVRLGGDYRHVGTKNYRNMMFVTLEDQRGLFEVILFPDVYDKYGGLVYETRAMRVTGMVQEGEHINGEVDWRNWTERAD